MPAPTHSTDQVRGLTNYERQKLMLRLRVHGACIRCSGARVKAGAVMLHGGKRTLVHRVLGAVVFNLADGAQMLALSRMGDTQTRRRVLILRYRTMRCAPVRSRRIRMTECCIRGYNSPHRGVEILPGSVRADLLERCARRGDRGRAALVGQRGRVVIVRLFRAQYSFLFLTYETVSSRVSRRQLAEHGSDEESSRNALDANSCAVLFLSHAHGIASRRQRRLSRSATPLQSRRIWLR